MHTTKKGYPVTDTPNEIPSPNSSQKRKAGQECYKSLAVYDNATEGELLLIEYEGNVPKVTHAIPLPMSEKAKKQFASTVINRPNIYWKFNPVTYQASKELYGATTCGREDITEVYRITFDLDAFPKFVKHTEKGKYPKRSDLIQVIQRVLPFAMIVSSNGAPIDEDGGLHVYIDLDTPTKDVQRVHAIAIEILKRLRIELKLLTADSDLCIDSTAGLERQLRAIGSKRDDGRHVCILKEAVFNETIEELEAEFPIPPPDPFIDTSIPITVDEQAVVQSFLRIKRGSEQDGSSRVTAWAKIACDKGVEAKQFLTLVEAAEEEWPLPAIDDGFGGVAAVWDEPRLLHRYNDVRSNPTNRFGSDARAKQVGEFSARKLITENPEPSEIIVEGLIRACEVANIIAPPKTGKSFLAMNLALAHVSGLPFLGRKVKQGQFAIFDFEVNPKELAQRIKSMALAMQLPLDLVLDNLDIYPFRGTEWTLEDILQFPIKSCRYTAVCFDALYRIIPIGISENDNSGMLSVYRTFDQIAKKWQCCVWLVHHSSKGSQDGKEVTDIGSGAGSISRAPDNHLVIRPHEQDGLFVLEAAPRNFPRPNPISIKFEYPLWLPSDVEPQRKVMKSPAKREADDRNDKDCNKVLASMEKAHDLDPEEWMSARDIRAQTGFGEKRMEALLALCGDRIERETKNNAKGTPARYFRFKLNGELPEKCKLDDLF